MKADKITVIKGNVAQNIISVSKSADVEHSKFFYENICDLLKLIVENIEEKEGLFSQDEELYHKINEICKKVKFNNIDGINEILKTRDDINASHVVNSKLNRYVFKTYCDIYNSLIDYINRKFSYISLEYKISSKIFDIDFVVVSNEQKIKKFNPSVDMQKKYIKELEGDLRELYKKGLEGSIEFLNKRDLLLNYYKGILEYIIEPGTKGKNYNSHNTEFCYNIGTYSESVGFKICGIRKESYCKHKNANLFAIVHGFLTKGRIYQKSEFYKRTELLKKEEYNENFVLRHQLIILSLIKNNVFNKQICVNIVDGTEDEFVLAFEDIKRYLTILCLLRKQDDIEFSYKKSKDGVSVSVRDNSGTIHCSCERWAENNYCWLEQKKILYNIDETDKEILNELAINLFKIEKLKEGQFDSIKNILNCKNNRLCLFPTGYGKSLIFYFTTYLSSGFTAIVNPTKVLIEDQKRNLESNHNIDNIMALEENLDYSALIPNSKIIYISSDLFVNESLIDKLAEFNSEGYLSCLVLDEVHSLSMWGHDFRPDYIAFSKYLWEFFTNAKVVGFTATANVKVLLELKRLLKVADNDVLGIDNPKRDDIIVESIAVESNEQVCEISAKIINEEKEYSRWLAFVKNKNYSNKVSKKLKRPYDLCLTYNIDTYTQFVEGKTDILLTSHEMGVGLNLPRVNSSLHVGYPVSINQFVQEVGRVAREDNFEGKAFVVAQGSSTFNEKEDELLDVTTPIDAIIDVVESTKDGDSDFIDLFRSAFGYLESPSKAVVRTIEIFECLKTMNSLDGELFFCPIDDEKTSKMVKFYLILLSNLGIIKKWFFKEKKEAIEVYQVERGSDWDKVAIIKEKIISIILSSEVGKSKSTEKASILIKNANTIREIIQIYVLWYYNNYLSTRREELVNIVFAVNDQDLSKYFVVEFKNAEEIRLKFNEKTIDEILTYNIENFDKKIVPTVVYLSEAEQLVKYDLFLLWSKGKNPNSDFKNRLSRVLNSFEPTFLRNNYLKLVQLYRSCCLNHRRELLKRIVMEIGEEETLMKFFERFETVDLYDDYYELLFNVINKKMEE